MLRTQTIDGSISTRGSPAARRASSWPATRTRCSGGRQLRRHARGWLPETSFRSRRTGRKTPARRSPAAPSGTRRRSRAPGADRAHRRPRAWPAGGRRRRRLDRGRDGLRLGTSLYVATQRYEQRSAHACCTASTPATRDSTRYAGSGSVPGTLLSQFSLSEYGGVLRAASTVGDDSESLVTTLAVRDGALVPRGRWAAWGAASGSTPCASSGRRLRRHLPPDRPALHARPLRSRPPAGRRRARAARLLGLPPSGGHGLLLGVGQEATRSGRVQGLQLRCSTSPIPRSRAGCSRSSCRALVELGRRVGPPRLPVVARGQPRRPARRRRDVPRRGRLPRRRRRAGSFRSGASSTTPRRRSSARSSSASGCSPCPNWASARRPPTLRPAGLGRFPGAGAAAPGA